MTMKVAVPANLALAGKQYLTTRGLELIKTTD